MGSKKIESFKIADTRKPTVSNPKKAAAPVEPSAPASVGFERLEKILDNETPDSVMDTLERMQKDLTTLQKRATKAKEKAAAKKGLAAIAQTHDLMSYLFQIKASLEASTSHN